MGALLSTLHVKSRPSQRPKGYGQGLIALFRVWIEFRVILKLAIQGPKWVLKLRLRGPECVLEPRL